MPVRTLKTRVSPGSSSINVLARDEDAIPGLRQLIQPDAEHADIRILI